MNLFKFKNMNITKLKIKVLENVQKVLVKMNNYLTSKTEGARINYLIGDATKPIKTGNKRIIAHICNDKGGWGAGFVLALSKRWVLPEQMYRSIPITELKLGNVQFVPVEDDIMVANMIAQHGYKTNANGKPPIRYGALADALRKVNKKALELNATVHMPRIGSGLAGGDWLVIEQLIEENVQVPVYVYDLN